MVSLLYLANFSLIGAIGRLSLDYIMLVWYKGGSSVRPSLGDYIVVVIGVIIWQLKIYNLAINNNHCKNTKFITIK